MLPPRSRLYGIGPGKTGTNALASVFTGVAAAHEAEAGTVIDAVMGYQSRSIRWTELRDLVVDRDRRLGLAVDVSNLHIFLVDLLVELSETAKFVLTVRDPYSWLDSILNHYLARPPTSHLRRFADWRFGHGRTIPQAEERSLHELGLHPLEGYLSYWRNHIQTALDAVPSDRLLVIRTDQIAAEADRIAAFAGIPPDCVRRAAIREYRNPHKRPVLEGIPRDHLVSQVERHCEPVLTRLFPEVRGPDDAGIIARTTETRP